jgi:hypothetical protein
MCFKITKLLSSFSILVNLSLSSSQYIHSIKKQEESGGYFCSRH